MKFDWDILDAYKLAIGKTFLYGNYGSFVANMGIPSRVATSKAAFTIQSKADLDKVISMAKEPEVVILHYPGIDMWYAYDNNIIPSVIDFRKTDKRITYGTTTFDTNYTISQFKKQFPNSAKPLFALPQSFFETTTKEKGTNFEHFILIRKTKDDPNATPMIELTFDKGKLIYIFFANF
ncbi:hypothetical protein [Chitinophaga flava]|nr:hypothetical protein [Chitinophaga flava]